MDINISSPVWSIIMNLIFPHRANQQAPRAGTPGFRAPEVLMKFPDQSTGMLKFLLLYIRTCLLIEF